MPIAVEWLPTVGFEHLFRDTEVPCLTCYARASGRRVARNPGKDL